MQDERPASFTNTSIPVKRSVIVLIGILVLAFALAGCTTTRTEDTDDAAMDDPVEEVAAAEDEATDEEVAEDTEKPTDANEAAAEDEPTETGDQATADEDATVLKIGVRTALSGPVATQGQEILNSVQLAVDQWNETTTSGIMIEVVEMDDESDPDTGVAVSESLCADDAVVAVVGSFQSAVGIPSSSVLNDCGLTYVAPGETNPELTDRELDGVNRVSPRDDDQGPALAIYAIETLGAESVFIIDDQSAGGAGLAVAFEERAGEIGLEVERAQIDVGQEDFTELLSDVPDAIDALVFYGFLPEGRLIAEQWAELGRTEPVMGGDPLFQQEEFIDQSDGAAEGAIVTFVGPDIREVPDAASYLEDYENEFGVAVSSYGPQAYEAASVILTAIGSLDEVDRDSLRDAVRATSEFHGILGSPVTFDERGDVAGGTIYVYKVIDGAFVQQGAIQTR